ncbi:MAG: LuxR C-terminal-related transcriptional regulator [Proteobacteria bacterium]|nr:LuxR C-terminal-related transcriptional regulator [Pseudomonadota bacterium]
MWRQAEQSVEREVDEQVQRLPHRSVPRPAARIVLKPGGTGFPARLANAILGDEAADPIAPLSPRETECLEWTAQGKTTWEIAQILCLSDSTVNYYIRNAMKKLAVHTKAHAVSKAAVLGMFG